MRTWMNGEGWRVQLSITDQVRASVALYAPGQSGPWFYREYAWWETRRAESEADALVCLGKMKEAAYAGVPNVRG